MDDYKAALSEDSSVAKPYSETGHLYQENRLLPRPVWFKGSRNRGLREDIAAWNKDLFIQGSVDVNRFELFRFFYTHNF